MRADEVVGRRMSLVDVEHALCMRAVSRGERASVGMVRYSPRLRQLSRYVKEPEVWTDELRAEVKIKAGRRDRQRAEKVYVVEGIVDRGEAEDGEMLYLVDWLGYGVQARTWEPEEMLRTDVPALVAEYEKAHPRTSRPAKRRKAS